MKTPIIIRWVARIWSITSLVFLAAFMVGSGGVPNVAESIGIAFFPFGVAAGLVIAWRHEGIGGAITTLSLAAFYLWMIIPSGRLPQGPCFLLVAAPGFLFLLSWLLGRFCPAPGTVRTT